MKVFLYLIDTSEKFLGRQFMCTNLNKPKKFLCDVRTLYIFIHFFHKKRWSKNSEFYVVYIARLV